MVSFLVALVGRTMIVRQFIGWIRTAPAAGRAEATRSLARAWLISDLSDDDRAAAEGAFIGHGLTYKRRGIVKQRRCAGRHCTGAGGRPGLGRATRSRIFSASDRR